MMRPNHYILVFVGVLLITSFFSQTCPALTLLTEEKALDAMFPDVDDIVTETCTLTETEIAHIRERLGGQLVHYQKGSKSEDISEDTTYTFFIGIKNNHTAGVAVIEEQPGKWGPVTFIIALNTASGKVTNLAVMAYKERRGRPIARRNFLKQFIDKGSADPVRIRKDIRAISGATISSDCACFAVKKVLALYEEVYQKRIKAAVQR